jgi:3'-5' exoribonuclease
MINSKQLSGFSEGSPVEGWLFINKVMIKTSRNQNNYYSIQGRDIKGFQLSVTLYDLTKKFEPETVIAVLGTIGNSFARTYTVYATSLVQVVDADAVMEFRSKCFPTVPKETLDKVMADLEAYAHSFQDPGLLKLSTALWDYFKPYAMTRPAGVKNHEPLIGGLALHTWQVVSLVNNALFIPNLDRDALLFSALYHDLGKSQEYTGDLQYTPLGKLFGHIPMGLELIHKYTLETGAVIPEVLLKHIKHCILTHHGKDAGFEHPSSREAIVVHYADELMATLGSIEEKIRVGGFGDDGWGSYDDNIKASVFVPQLIKLKEKEG